MADAGARLDWLSAHLHLVGSLYGAEADRVVLDVVAPVVRRCRERGWIRRAFFLRYSVGGAHLRFRLQGRPETLAGKVRGVLLDQAADRGVPEVRWVPYEPELERYGGPAGVEVAEELFDASSRTTLALLRRLPADDRSARLGHALAAMVTGLAVFVGERALAAALAGDYGSVYLRQSVPQDERLLTMTAAFERGVARQDAALAQRVELLWQGAVEGGGLPAELEAYRGELLRVHGRLRRVFAAGGLRARRGGVLRDWGAAVRQLLPSYLHMTTNRLGVAVIDECYLSRIVAAVLAPRRRTA
jgi:thiopeptide-type bacteriocin biosynthesis protein